MAGGHAGSCRLSSIHYIICTREFRKVGSFVCPIILRIHRARKSVALLLRNVHFSAKLARVILALPAQGVGMQLKLRVVSPNDKTTCTFLDVLWLVSYCAMSIIVPADSEGWPHICKLILRGSSQPPTIP